ncbi:hypothetical protein [Mycobacterium sp. TY814]|uniref:hypothetical protein n=1 Tax=Mycobacterium sp. TY814 TaxID=3050580 RepID=UPI0027409FF2|nr:hypothetical protein [Mycobacterium sp. TY814]MDP7724186.1 hypothetical protein [Mycobacterium sp. TY814]
MLGKPTQMSPIRAADPEAAWLVLRFNYQDGDGGWLKTIAQNPSVFGQSKATA